MRRTTAPLTLTTSALTPTALATTALLGLALLSPATAAAAETCRGEAATVVGAPGERIVGTEARDVVVTNGSTRVNTLGGDDLVCVNTTTGGRHHLREVDVHTGAGNDLVDSAATMLPLSVRVVLGTGADRFEGGKGSDVVAAGETDPIEGGQDSEGWHLGRGKHVDTDADVIVGGGGSDDITSGQDRVPNADVVLGGTGSDALVYAGHQEAPGRLSGGDDDDQLLVLLGPGSTTADATTRRLTAASSSVSWTTIEGFWFTAADEAARTLVYRGTEDADQVDVTVSAGLSLVADLAGGDDSLQITSAPAAGSDIDLGAGTDTLLALARHGTLDLDMRAELLTVTVGASTHAVPVAGLETAGVFAPRVVIAGTDRADYLLVGACRATVRGRAGDDHVSYHGAQAMESSVCSARAVLDGGAGADELFSFGSSSRDTMRGGPGHDHLLGGRGPDRLLGGPGRDFADGGAGPKPDTCRGERENRCER